MQDVPKVTKKDQLVSEYSELVKKSKELFELKLSFTKYLENNGFSMNHDDRDYLRFSNSNPNPNLNLVIIVTKSQLEDTKFIVLKVFNDEWSKTFSSSEVDQLQLFIDEILHTN